MQTHYICTGDSQLIEWKLTLIDSTLSLSEAFYTPVHTHIPPNALFFLDGNVAYFLDGGIVCQSL